VAVATAAAAYAGEALIFLLCAAIVPVMAILPTLAYVGEREPAARVATVIIWFLAFGGFALVTFGTAAGVAMGPDALAAFQQHRPAREVAALMPAGGATRIAWAAIGIAAGVVAGAVGFTRAARTAAARWLPLDAGSFVHATALASVIALIVICVVPLLVLGAPPALSEGASGQTAEQMKNMPAGLLLRATCYFYFWLIAGLVFFVGFPVARSLPAALRRLGLVVPTVGQVLIALVAAVVLLFVMDGVDWGIGRLWQVLGWPRTDTEAFNGLMTYAMSPIGAVVVGVTAGLSEEMAVRGVLQPRLGILLSNVVFTALHALQYNWDALLSVFLIGLLLGLVRRRYNTTTSAIVHGTYDYLAMLLTIYAPHAGG